MDIYFIIAFMACIFYAFYKYKKALQMLQQNWYNEGNRYLKWLSHNVKKVVCFSELLLLAVFIPFDYQFKIIVLDILLLYLCYAYSQKNKKDQTKIKLVVTKRIKRLIMTISLVYLIPVLFSVYFEQSPVLIILCFIIFNTFAYLIVYFANIINKPIEKMVFLYYKRQAITKLKNMPYMKVIGITGSYGKTSSKNILYDILSIKFNSFKTPKNFNTTYGLINSINNYLDKFCDYFIAEMGAFKQGDIKELCDLMQPQFGIITTIGTAHLESFGNQENIINGKFELIESLPSNGIGILNMDDPLQRNYNIKNKCNILWISTENKNADLYATNIKITSDGTKFDCFFKGDKKKYTFETNLLGDHNVYNILAGVLLGYKLGINIDRLQSAVSRVQPVEHRLQLKHYNEKISIIDDAYNSNPVGSKKALDVLRLMPGKRVIVTPGMIELGSEQYKLNYEFGQQISKVADYVILVGEKQTKPIYEGLVDSHYDKTKICVINDVKKAFRIIDDFSDKKIYVLLENDLPDIFNE